MTPEIAQSDELKQSLGETLDSSDEQFTELCKGLEKDTGIPVVLMDANDIDQNQLGKCTDFPLTDEEIQDAMADNPSGQGDELTPLILIRPLS